MKQTILIAGAGGQLGAAMTQRFADTHQVVAASRSDLDVTSSTHVAGVVARVKPAVIINCSAYTDVDGAERNPVSAFAVNALAVRHLAQAAVQAGAVFVHYSTDFVFDGAATQPYAEDDAPNPKSAYAMSKLLGEWFAAEAPRHYVLRVESLFGGPLAKSSVDKILANLRADRPVKAFVDRAVSPSFVDDVVWASERLLATDAPFGLYHCVNSGWTNWVGISEELARLVGCERPVIEPVRMADLSLVAPRPLFAALANGKLRAQGIEMPTWQDALRRYVAAAPVAS